RLTASQADANWVKLAGAEAAETLRNRGANKQTLEEGQQLLQTQKEQLQCAQQTAKRANQHLQEREKQILQVNRDLDAALTQLHDTSAARARAERDIAGLQPQLAPFLAFGPWSLGLARRAQSITRRFPSLSRTVKRC